MQSLPAAATDAVHAVAEKVAEIGAAAVASAQEAVHR